MTIGGRSLRARITRTLVGLGFVSVILLAVVNTVVVHGLLDRGTRDQLETLRELRTDTIEQTIEGVLNRVSVMGTDPGVSVALGDLSEAYAQIDTDVDDAQLDELRAAYAPVTEPYDAVQAPRPTTDELVPTSPAGRTVQYQYIAQNRLESRADLTDAGDGSAYSAAHAEHHPFLRDLAASIGARDLLLIGLDSQDVIYSVSKRIDLGTDVADGPFVPTGLGTVASKLESTAVDASVVSDTAFYLPDSTVPVVHIATTVRSDAEVLGALVIVVPTDRLTQITTADQQWDLLGLGETGDAYIVGADRTLRTDPRPWFDDPDAYIDRYRDVGGTERVAELMAFTGSPVLLHEIDDPAVDAALDGRNFVGESTNLLGHSTLAAAAPLDVADLGWVIVTEQRTSETRSELGDFVVTLLVVLAILVVVLVVIGLVLARVLARPVRPLVAAARRIADGDYSSEVPDLGRNELGDVGRQLDAVATHLREQEASIEAEEARINDMLASVLPPGLVERVRSGERDLAEVVDTATVISVSVTGIPAPSGAEQDAVAELTTRLADETSRLAHEHGVERAQAALEHQLYITGRGQSGVDARAAARFARDVVAALPVVGAEFGLQISAGAGLSAGLVATGVVGSRQVSFGVWGHPVDDAVALGDRAAPGEVRLDASVVDELDDADASPIDGTDAEWRFEATDQASM